MYRTRRTWLHVARVGERSSNLRASHCRPPSRSWDKQWSRSFAATHARRWEISLHSPTNLHAPRFRSLLPTARCRHFLGNALSPDAERSGYRVRRVSRVLKAGAPFLFTAAEIPEVGDNDPGITGTMNGVTFYYHAVPDYRTFIDRDGFELVDVVDDPGVSTYYFARRRA